MSRLPPWLARAAALLAFCGTTLAACSPCDCTNPCTRSYAIGKPNEVTGAIINRSESAYDCKIRSVAPSISEGRHALSATIAARREPSTNIWGAYLYDLSLVAVGTEADLDQVCAGVIMRFASAAELGATSLDVGTALCIVDEVHPIVSCTQLGCGY